MEALWISYSAALKMIQLVADDANRSCLYFAQDSVHVMIAYAAIFLIKVPEIKQHDGFAAANSKYLAVTLYSQVITC